MSAEDMENRFAYHPPKDQEIADLHSKVRREVKETANFLDIYLTDSREKSLAITKLEEAMMWANACIARHMNGEQ